MAPPVGEPPDCGACLTRRSALIGVAGVAVAAVSSCARYGTSSSAPPPVPPPTPPPTPTGSSSAAGSGTRLPAGALATTAQVPVGGGVILSEARVVITQPTAGSFLAFSAVCTHAGCTVGTVADGQIQCPCHGSRFTLEGAVARGPAAEPLAPFRIRVVGETIRPA